ncbi:MAG: phycobilisome rod-core linker polypeptide [Actinomycetota bacterium]|nr:phycobilisome rod-core linker polypeptide [Actinomycetota bacterium]
MAIHEPMTLARDTDVPIFLYPEEPTPPDAFVVEAYAVAAVLSSAAEFINAVDQIYVDVAGGGRQLHQDLRPHFERLLRELKTELHRGIRVVLDELRILREAIQSIPVSESISQAETALYSWLKNGRNGDAEAWSLQAVIRLRDKWDPIYVTPWIHVVNIRLAVLKQIYPDRYFCPELGYVDEFREWVQRLEWWARTINDAIRPLHTVAGPFRKNVGLVDSGPGDDDPGPRPKPRPRFVWAAEYRVKGVTSQEFQGRDLSPESHEQVRAAAARAQAKGIEADRTRLGVVAMEKAAAAWRQAFAGSLRQALVRELLNRPAELTELDPDGFRLEGRVLPADMPLRDVLLHLLCSWEFRRRVERSWTGLVERGDHRLTKFAYQRLFGREPKEEEASLLREVASAHGFRAYVAALLYSDEYERRFGENGPGPSEQSLSVALEEFGGPGQP